MIGVVGYILICTLMVWLTIIITEETNNEEPGQCFCILLCMVVFVYSLTNGILTIADLWSESHCEKAGYAESMSYEQNDFCVGYIDQKPFFVSVDEIEGWNENE